MQERTHFYALVLTIAFAFELCAGLLSPLRADDSHILQPLEKNEYNVMNLEEARARASAILSRMTLRQKAGQVLLIGFRGRTFAEDLESRLSVVQPGGILFFSRNIASSEDAANVIHLAQLKSIELVHTPLLVAVDQEGGQVLRVKSSPPIPSAYTVGLVGDAKLSYEIGRETGRLLRSIGFNMNLAPVLDLADPDKTSFIGTRSFGLNPVRVGDIASGFSEGLLKAGVLPTAKHFPGHGDTEVDSHIQLPTRTITLEDLMKADLIPFNQFFQTLPLSAVMVAHVAVPKIDDEGLPASYSHVLLTDILRNKLEYKGLVLTDDLQMSGANLGWKAQERAARAFAAGADMVMVVWNLRDQENAVRGIMQAIKSGRIPQGRLDESVLRILTYKEALRLRNIDLPNSDRIIKSSSHSPKLRSTVYSLVKQVLDRGVSSVKPSWGPDEDVLVVSTSSEFSKSFKRNFRSRRVRHFIVTRSTSLSGIKKILTDHPRSHTIYYVTGAKTRNLLKSIPEDMRDRILVLNAETPGHLSGQAGFSGIIQIGSRMNLAGEIFARSLEQALLENQRTPVWPPKDAGTRSKNSVQHASAMESIWQK